MVELRKSDLTPTKKAYFRVFDTFYSEQLSQKEAYCATENYFEDLGHESPYDSFERFKMAYWLHCKKDLKKNKAA